MQVVDDILDFTSTAEQLGKPRYQDIESGNLTAPTLFAMKKCPELVELVESEFTEDGSVQRAVQLIEQHGGAHWNSACGFMCCTAACLVAHCSCACCTILEWRSAVCAPAQGLSSSAHCVTIAELVSCRAYHAACSTMHVPPGACL